MNTDIFLPQLETLLIEFNSMRSKSEHNDISDLPKTERQALVTKSIAAINRIVGKNSIYANEVERIIKESPSLHIHTSSIIGIIIALRDHLKAGYIQSLVELAHSDVFTDFLEMAQHLCDANYKDAATVIADSTLESHLRALCNKGDISTEVLKADGDKVPKRAESMNSDLATATTYSKLDQKSITAWLDLRNKAAHGKYNEYTLEQVSILVSGVQNFIVRNPA